MHIKRGVHIDELDVGRLWKDPDAVSLGQRRPVAELAADLAERDDGQ